MPFGIENKVALISGGASGLGLQYAKELLKNGLRGVTLADVNDNFGKQALGEIEKEFGPNKAIYVRTDVIDMKNYEEAFKKTVGKFKNLDILINNAGIMNDAIWEKQIAINVNGVVHGVLLGLENYIPKHKTGEDGVIVNISSIAGVAPFANLPVYTATKFAVSGMTKAFGDEAHFKRTKVRVVAFCPGTTLTPLIFESSGRNLGPAYEQILQDISGAVALQDPESVSPSMIKVIKNAKTGTLWIAEGEQEPYEFVLPPRESFAPKK